MENVTLEARRQEADISLGDSFTKETDLYTIDTIQGGMAVCKVAGRLNKVDVPINGILLSLIKQQIIRDANEAGVSALDGSLPPANLEKTTATFVPKEDITVYELARIIATHAPVIISVNVKGAVPIHDSILKHFK